MFIAPRTQKNTNGWCVPGQPRHGLRGRRITRPYGNGCRKFFEERNRACLIPCPAPDDTPCELAPENDARRLRAWVTDAPPDRLRIPALAAPARRCPCPLSALRR